MKNKENKKYIRQILIKLPFLLLIPFGLWIPDLAARNPEGIERVYGGIIYPIVAQVIGAISALVPSVSLAECLLGAGILAIVILIIVTVTGIVLRRVSILRFISGVMTLAVIGGVMLTLFYGVWGLNYTRAPLATRMELTVKERPLSELEEVSAYLAERAAEYRELTDENAEGVFECPWDYKECFTRVSDTYDNLGATLNTAYNAVYPAKPVYMSEAMSYAGISGIYIPFTSECNVNIGQPWLLIPAAAAHENAHSVGIAPEDEADFVSFLACLESDEPAIAYSGCISALMHCTNRLYERDPDAYFRVRELYSDAMVRDLVDYNKYWTAHEGPVEETMNNVNDGYLRHNQQESGVASYGEMVDLLLAYYFDRLDTIY